MTPFIIRESTCTITIHSTNTNFNVELGNYLRGPLVP